MSLRVSMPVATRETWPGVAMGGPTERMPEACDGASGHVRGEVRASTEPVKGLGAGCQSKCLSSYQRCLLVLVLVLVLVM